MLPVFIVMFLFWKVWKKTKFIASKDVDLLTFRDAVDFEEEQFQVRDAEEKAFRQANGNPKDVKWFYDKLFGWIF